MLRSEEERTACAKKFDGISMGLYNILEEMSAPSTSNAIGFNAQSSSRSDTNPPSLAAPSAFPIHSIDLRSSGFCERSRN